MVAVVLVVVLVVVLEVVLEVVLVVRVDCPGLDQEDQEDEEEEWNAVHRRACRCEKLDHCR
jgi:hypothetical protein